MYKGLSRPPFETLFQLMKHDKTRGHALKLTKHCTNRDVRLHFFSERVINNWNNLDQSVVEAGRVNTFKQRLQSHGNNKTSWIDVRKVLGRIWSFLLVRPYQVKNQVKKSHL